MAKATAKACMKKKSGKKTVLVLIAPGNLTFSSHGTKAVSATDGPHTWTIGPQNQSISTDGKKMTIRLDGTARIAAARPPKKGQLTVDPTAENLIVTLTDPPPGMDTTTDPLPVECVDDFD